MIVEQRRRELNSRALLRGGSARRSRPLDFKNRLREHGLEATEYELGMAMELTTSSRNSIVRETLQFGVSHALKN